LPNKGKGKGKGHALNRPQGPKWVPGRLRPRIFLTFGTTRVVDRQPHAPAAFTPRGNPWYSFIEAESTPRHMVLSVATEKIPSVTPPVIDPETVRLVEQCLNHYATPGPLCCLMYGRIVQNHKHEVFCKLFFSTLIKVQTKKDENA
jgi:hypothetical protein